MFMKKYKGKTKLIDNSIEKFFLKWFKPRKYNRILGYEALAEAFNLFSTNMTNKGIIQMLNTMTNNNTDSIYKWPLNQVTDKGNTTKRG